MTGEPVASPLDDAAIDAICAHMNDDHGEDSLLIVRTLGTQPDSTGARMTGLDATAAVFVATVDGAEREVRVPWSAPITERAQVRAEVVRMYQEACAAAGIAPRDAAEH